MVFDAVASLLRRLAGEQPVLVVLDDLHWADPGTVRLLRFVAPDLPRTRLLVLGAYRDDEVGNLRDAVERAIRIGAWPWVAASRCELAALAGTGPEALELLDQVQHAAADLGLADVSSRAAELRAALSAGYQGTFRREGDVWTLTFQGTTVHLPDAKGLRDIARLLAAPGVELAAADLLGQEAAAEAVFGADAVLDARARQEYRSRLARLDPEIDAADARGDPERSASAQAERDALIRGLSAAAGLAGRPRRLGEGSERARKAVTMRIKDALRRIDARHPTLGRHLRQSISTGTVCVYRPAEPVRWTL